MRFKRLPNQDLQQLEKEFINFLASSGVTADDWKDILNNKPEQQEELINLFSDIVYEKVFQKIQYLDFRAINDFKVFQLGKDEITMIGVQLPTEITIDFNVSEEFNAFFQSIPNGCKIISTSKKYIENREDEIFEMMENGCCTIEKELFTSIKKLIR